ncbi:Hypothetical_protein [Hexamita inflata]|uniref:Hypothetical_protein n=1 Tax=Hexamita inflata TaxID=28002 RepID=A0AA86NW12_9EUKA|nr:Hypothetical protein HINF_LOCUS14123 [Hexamita inflata]
MSQSARTILGISKIQVAFMWFHFNQLMHQPVFDSFSISYQRGLPERIFSNQLQLLFNSQTLLSMSQSGASIYNYNKKQYFNLRRILATSLLQLNSKSSEWTLKTWQGCLHYHLYTVINLFGKPKQVAIVHRTTQKYYEHKFNLAMLQYC